MRTAEPASLPVGHDPPAAVNMMIRLLVETEPLLPPHEGPVRSEMANALAHQINNPLQSITNLAYLVAEGIDGKDQKALGRELVNDIGRLSSLVKELLALNYDTD